MAGQSDALFEEEVLKRRLVIEGDGRSDLIKISLLSRNYIAWVRNDEDGAGEAAAKGGQKQTPATKDKNLKDAALESRVLRMASRLQGDMVRSLESIRVIEESTEEYREVQKEIQAAMEDTEGYINANNYLMPNSKEQRKKRKEEGEMDLLQTLVDKQLGREELEKMREMKIRELGQIKVQEAAFQKKMNLIRAKVRVLSSCSRSLASDYSDMEEGGRERREPQGAEGGSSATEVVTSVAGAFEEPAGAAAAGTYSLSAITSTESMEIEKNASSSLEPISPSPGGSTSSDLSLASTEKMQLSSEETVLVVRSGSWSKGPGPSANAKSGSGKHDEVDRRMESRKVNTTPGNREGQPHGRDSKGDKQKGPLAATATQSSGVRDDYNGGGPKRKPTRFATVNKGKFDRMKN